MVTGSKKHLETVKKQIDADLAKFNQLETTKNEITKEIPAWVFERNTWQACLNWDKMDVSEYERRLNQVISYVNNVNASYPEVKALFDAHKDILPEPFHNVDKFKLVSLKYDMDKIINEHNMQLEKAKKLLSEEDILIGLKPVTQKEEYIELSFDSVIKTKKYYKDNYSDFFDCGKDYYQDEATDYCYIRDILFKVTMVAEIDSTKNVEGCHRLYWVDRIKNVYLEPFDQDELNKLRSNNLAEQIKKAEEALNNLKAKVKP